MNIIVKPSAEQLLNELADILYPLDGYRGDQWDGGDVCEAVADILHRYMPEAATRQPEWSEEEEAHECIRVWVLDEPTRGWCDICDRTMDADVCPTCNGAGATGANGPDPDSCTSCRGVGWVAR